MPADTFESIWREVRAYSPKVDPELCKRWVRNRFRDIIRKRLWSWAVAESQFGFPDEYKTGTISVTANSDTLTGSSTVWTTAAHGDLQIRIKNQVFTVKTVSSNTSIIMDRVWPEKTEAGVSYSIRKAYITVPDQFKGFVSVIDPESQYQMRLHFNVGDLDRIDPARTTTGTPSLVVDLRWSTVDARPMFEVWPHILSIKGIRALYWKTHSDLSDTQNPPYTVGGDVLVTGALANLCRYPGTQEVPNPMFNLKLTLIYEEEFKGKVFELEREDGEVYVDNLWYDAINRPYVPIDSKYLQSHAFGPF